MTRRYTSRLQYENATHPRLARLHNHRQFCAKIFIRIAPGKPLQWLRIAAFGEGFGVYIRYHFGRVAKFPSATLASLPKPDTTARGKLTSLRVASPGVTLPAVMLSTERK
jgi:hypothetical protein